MIYLATTESIARAAEHIKSGALVAFPTETVYGLGANALNPIAVESIFQLKGRPASNPLIVHLHSRSELSSVVSSNLSAHQQKWLDSLSELWPGPLSLILPRNEKLPAVVSGGKQTVAVRIPRHPVALKLIERAGCPIAAPSANKSNYVSPTSAAHVNAEFGADLECILDGGPCAVGIESTVVSLVHTQPTILRPGSISKAELEALVGPVGEAYDAVAAKDAVSPGMLAKHYSPRTPVRFSDPHTPLEPGKRIGILCLEPRHNHPITGAVVTKILSKDGNLEEIAQNLYSALRELDDQGLDLILVERCPSEGIGVAIMNRLERAVSELATSKK